MQRVDRRGEGKEVQGGINPKLGMCGKGKKSTCWKKVVSVGKGKKVFGTFEGGRSNVQILGTELTFEGGFFGFQKYQVLSQEIGLEKRK